MATKTETMESHSHLALYNKTIIALGVITILELIAGTALDGALKTFLLVVFSLMKATAVVAIFMHAKDDSNPKMIVGFVFIAPLIFGTILLLTLIKDWRGPTGI